jgi:hypothetical protein
LDEEPRNTYKSYISGGKIFRKAAIWKVEKKDEVITLRWILGKLIVRLEGESIWLRIVSMCGLHVEASGLVSDC